jgi:hypothetical protein
VDITPYGFFVRHTPCCEVPLLSFIDIAGPIREIYYNDLQEVKLDEILTEIMIPVEEDGIFQRDVALPEKECSGKQAVHHEPVCEGEAGEMAVRSLKI